MSLLLKLLNSKKSIREDLDPTIDTERDPQQDTVDKVASMIRAKEFHIHRLQGWIQSKGIVYPLEDNFIDTGMNDQTIQDIVTYHANAANVQPILVKQAIIKLIKLMTAPH